VYTHRPDGKYDVTLTMTAGKSRFDSVGNETPVPMDNDLIDVGVLGSDGRFLYLQKHPMHTGTNVVTVTVDGEPAQAGIDPMYELINRSTAWNVVAVQPAS
jgi:ABC-2 type transport system permease protein